MSSEPPPSLADTHPDRHKWPTWIAPSVHMLEKMIKGRHWTRAMEDWLTLEGILEYPEGKVCYIVDYSNVVQLILTQGEKKTLSSKGRPDAIHNWLKHHCNLGNMPDVTHFVDGFTTQWEEWYMHLQPDWCLNTPSEDADVSGISLSQDPTKDTIISDWQDIK